MIKLILPNIGYRYRENYFKLNNKFTYNFLRKELFFARNPYRVFARHVDGLWLRGSQRYPGEGGWGGRARGRLGCPEHAYPGRQLGPLPPPQLLQVLQDVPVVGVIHIRVPGRQAFQVSPLTLLQNRRCWSLVELYEFFYFWVKIEQIRHVGPRV